VIPEETSELELRDYLRVLRRRKLIVVATLVVVVAAAVISSLVQTPVYAAQARLLLQARSTESLFNSQTGQRNDPERLVQTEIEVLNSEPVRDAVRSQLGFSAKASGRAVGQTDVISVRAESTDPKRAAAVANAYATAYIDFRRKQAVDDILAAGEEIQTRVTDLQKQIDALDERSKAEAAKARPGDALEQQTLLQSLSAQKAALAAQQGLFKQKLDELKVDSALKTGGAQLVGRASVPISPVRPTPRRNAILAAVMGLLLGVGLAFLRDYFDDSIKTKDDLERAVPGVAAIGIIPAVAGWKAKEEPRVVSVTDPKSSAAEAYRTLRTSIQFLGLEHPMRTLQMTSASAGEGKTTTLANLGVALANAGQNVIVVCCDLRRPRIHEFFGLDNKVGFTSVLLGDVPLPAALQPVPNVARLSLLASGPPPPNPSEMLSSHRAAEVFVALKARSDIVLIDSPPILPVTDALVLSRGVDATLLVCTARSTSRKEATRAAELLRQVDARVVGTVLNGVSSEGGYGESYQYYRYYSKDEPKKGPGPTGAKGPLLKPAAKHTVKG